MADLMLQAEPRVQFGKNASRRLRSRGRIPGVIYGHGFETVGVSVDPTEVLGILRSETGRNTIFKIQMGTQMMDVLVRDFQLDPVRGNLLHADFQKISMDKPMVFQVPVGAVGVPEGVRLNGGILDVVLRQIEVECLPGEVPDHIHVDVSGLRIGDAVRVGELVVDSSKVRILSDPDLVVLTIVPPHLEVEAVAAAGEEAPAEPELIRKARPEEEGESSRGSGG